MSKQPKRFKSNMKICVYGSASDNLQSFMSTARKIGQIIRQGGHSLANGSFSKGTLGEAAKGAKECGAEISTVVSDGLRKGQPLFDICRNRAQGNM